MVKPFSQARIAVKLWSRYLAPGSPVPELKPTTTSLPADSSPWVHSKAISKIDPSYVDMGLGCFQYIPIQNHTEMNILVLLF